MSRDTEQFSEAGAPLVVIGQGTPANAAHFRERFDLDLDLLVDTDRRAYKAAGTKVGSLSELLGAKVIARGLRRARDSRVLQGRVDGHPAQLGGLMLVTPGGEAPWVHLSDDASDYPPNAVAIESVRWALGRSDAGPTAA